MAKRPGKVAEAQAEAPAPRGRPSGYCAELARDICLLLAEGKSLRRICTEERFPSESTVRGWVVDDREGFSAQYARAKEMGLHSMAEETIEIADDGANDTYTKEDGSEGVNSDVVQRSRLRVDARKWFLSKMMPKVYGDKVTQEMTGVDGAPLQMPTLVIAPFQSRDEPDEN